MRLLPETVIKRASKAQARKDEWRDVFEQCYKYALPQRNLHNSWEGGARGQSKMSDVFDSTAINSTQRFANRLQSVLFPPYQNWCRLVAGDEVPPEHRDDVQRALDFYGERFFSVLRQSSFDLAISEFLLDLAVGTGAMLIQPGEPVSFESVPLFLIAVEEGPSGRIDTVYRKLRIKCEAISQQWPDAELCEDLREKLREHPTDDVDLLEATIYIPDGNYWCYHVIHEPDKHDVVYREMTSSPWVIARWCKAAGEALGRGPLLSALPDIATLNQTKKLLLQNASLGISGMYTAADDGVLNPQTIRIQPGAIIPVARNGGPQGASLQPLQRSGDVNLSQLIINDLTVSIKKIMLDDTLPPDTMSARSATEVNARMQELASNMGSAFGRLITEAMIPIVSRTLDVMDQENIIDLPLKVDGRQIKVVPISPLAKAQANDELGSVLQFAQLAAQSGPAGQVALNQTELINFVADRLGVPARLMNTEEQRAELMAVQQQQIQMAQMEEALQGGREMG